MVFHHLYSEAEKLFGDTAARQLTYKIVKETTKDLVEKIKEMGYLSYFIDPNDPCKSFKMIYKVFGIENVHCEASEEEVKISISGCPLPDKYDKEKKGSACIVMIAIVSGLVEEIMGKKILIETPVVRFGHPRPQIKVKMLKSKLLGDEGCEFEARMIG